MQDKDTVINSTGTGTLGRVGIYRRTDNSREMPVVPDSHVTVIRAKTRVNEISDSINCIAIRVNQTGKIYHEDMEVIRQGIAEISDMLAEYQAKLESFAVTPQTFRAIVDKAHEDVRK